MGMYTEIIFKANVKGDIDTCIGWKWYEEDDKPTLLFPTKDEITED